MSYRKLEEQYKKEDEFVLWKKYKQNKDPNIKEFFVRQYELLAKNIAGKMKNRLSNNVEYDDLVSCANIGLLDAIEKFQPEKKNKFTTYATIRIRGHVYDELRTEDWIPRDIRKKTKDINKTVEELRDKIGKEPSDEEIAKNLNIPVEELNKWKQKSKNLSVFSLDNDRFQNDGSKSSYKDGLESSYLDPHTSMERRELHRIVYETIKSLPDKEKIILVLYYYEDLKMKEIGEALELTESRISQILKEALIKLKLQLYEIMSN